jgi:hypothetical protein
MLCKIRPYFTVSDSRLPNLEGQVPVFISPRNRTAQLYPQALCSLFVASYDSKGYGGGISVRFRITVILRLSIYADQFDLGPSTTRLTTRDFFQLNPCGNSPYITSSLTRRWIGFAFRQVYESHI